MCCGSHFGNLSMNNNTMYMYYVHVIVETGNGFTDLHVHVHMYDNYSMLECMYRLYTKVEFSM